MSNESRLDQKDFDKFVENGGQMQSADRFEPDSIDVFVKSMGFSREVAETDKTVFNLKREDRSGGSKKLYTGTYSYSGMYAVHVFKNFDDRDCEFDALNKMRESSVKCTPEKFAKGMFISADGKQLPALAEEYFDSPDLDKLFTEGMLVAQDGKKVDLPARDAAEILLGAVVAINEIHRKGLVHRDLKPSNIIYEQGLKKTTILDLGTVTQSQYTSKTTRDRSVSGFFTAPERRGLYRPDELDQFRMDHSPMLDVYSLGVTLAYLASWFTLANPYAFESELSKKDGCGFIHPCAFNLGVAIEKRMFFREPLVDELALSLVIERCTDPDPRKRPTAEGMAKALEIIAKTAPEEMVENNLEEIGRVLSESRERSECYFEKGELLFDDGATAGIQDTSPSASFPSNHIIAETSIDKHGLPDVPASISLGPIDLVWDGGDGKDVPASISLGPINLVWDGGDGKEPADRGDRHIINGRPETDDKNVEGFAAVAENLAIGGTRKLGYYPQDAAERPYLSGKARKLINEQESLLSAQSTFLHNLVDLYRTLPIAGTISDDGSFETMVAGILLNILDRLAGKNAAGWVESHELIDAYWGKSWAPSCIADECRMDFLELHDQAARLFSQDLYSSGKTDGELRRWFGCGPDVDTYYLSDALAWVFARIFCQLPFRSEREGIDVALLDVASVCEELMDVDTLPNPSREESAQPLSQAIPRRDNIDLKIDSEELDSDKGKQVDGILQNQPSYDVILHGTGKYKNTVVKVVRTLTGLCLKDALDLVNSAPKAVLEGAKKEDAETAKAMLEGAGALVSLKPSNENVRRQPTNVTIRDIGSPSDPADTKELYDLELALEIIDWFGDQTEDASKEQIDAFFSMLDFKNYATSRFFDRALIERGIQDYVDNNRDIFTS